MAIDKFCFCGKLPTGGMVIGILGLIGNLLLLFLFIPFLLQGIESGAFQDKRKGNIIKMQKMI